MALARRVMVWEHRSKTHKALDSGVQFCLMAMVQCRQLVSPALYIWDNFLFSGERKGWAVVNSHVF